MVDSICVIAGVPRSGTSWLGMLVDSCPQVAYRFQPLFSYAFKGAVDVDSSPADFATLMERMLITEDDFLVQADKRANGLYPVFRKELPARCLAFKTCRYQYLLLRLLESLPQLKLVGIVRHPCGALHSWLTNPKEFPAGADPLMEWRFGACKNRGRAEEFFGFYKWKEVAHLYLDLAEQWPARVELVQYETLVGDTRQQVQRLYDFLQLPLTEQTSSFIEQCHAHHIDSPYAVYKDPAVAYRWRKELAPAIQDAVARELRGTRLERFLA